MEYIMSYCVATEEPFLEHWGFARIDVIVAKEFALLNEWGTTCP
jgi:hypothetical protein